MHPGSDTVSCQPLKLQLSCLPVLLLGKQAQHPVQACWPSSLDMHASCCCALQDELYLHQLSDACLEAARRLLGPRRALLWIRCLLPLAISGSYRMFTPLVLRHALRGDFGT